MNSESKQGYSGAQQVTYQGWEKSVQDSLTQNERTGKVYNSSLSGNRKSPWKKVFSICVAWIIVGICIGLFIFLYFSNGIKIDFEENNVLKEERTSADVAPVGEYTVDFFDQTVTAGEYVIGQEIPAGIYTISLSSDQGEVDLNLDDYENGLFEFLVFSHEEYDADYQVESFEGLALMEGGELRLEGAGTLNFYCEEAYYTQNWTQQENPMDISYEVESEMEVGTDLEPGVYDVVLEEGEGDLRIQRGDEYGFSLYLSSEADYGTREFRNLNLPEGTILTLEKYGDDCKVSLHPSERIYEPAEGA